MLPPNLELLKSKLEADRLRTTNQDRLLDELQRLERFMDEGLTVGNRSTSFGQYFKSYGGTAPLSVGTTGTTCQCCGR